MAEILLSLTIIGVVAAITLPSLTGNINERTWNTQRKALYARFSQAISLMPALNGFGTLAEATSSAAAVDTAGETFVTSGLSKVLKINNICDNEHLADCGIVSSYTNMAGSKVVLPTTLNELNSLLTSVTITAANVSYKIIDTKAVAFETQNGESIVMYYNPTCGVDYFQTSNWNESHMTVIGTSMCANFVYDLNGSKGPNTVGKDIGFLTAFNSIDSKVVAPVPISSNDQASSTSYHDAISICKSKDSESRLPNIDELSSMFVNGKFIGTFSAGDYWSSSRYDSKFSWRVSANSGLRSTSNTQLGSFNVRCIKR